MEFHDRYRRINAEILNTHRHGDSLGILGFDYQNLGESAKALAAYSERLRTAQEEGDPHSESAALGGMAMVNHSLGRLEVAMQCYFDCLEIAR